MAPGGLRKGERGGGKNGNFRSKKIFLLLRRFGAILGWFLRKSPKKISRPGGGGLYKIRARQGWVGVLGHWSSHEGGSLPPSSPSPVPVRLFMKHTVYCTIAETARETIEQCFFPFIMLYTRGVREKKRHCFLTSLHFKKNISKLPSCTLLQGFSMLS